MLSLEFETPKHGWMPVKIVYKEHEEYFDVSDVPLNPISQLEYVLYSAIAGRGGEVWWHLEPAGYYLNLHEENGLFRIKLEYSVNSTKNTRELVFEDLIDFNEVIIPLWRSLRKLQSYKWDEFSVSARDMDSITKKVKSRQKG